MHRKLTAVMIAGMTAAASGAGECTEQETKIDSLVAGGNINVCPCFIPNEVAMMILDTPAGGTPTLSKIQVFWASFFGGAPDSLEAALIVYDMNQTGPANPATFAPLCAVECTIAGPVLSDGVLNQFDVLGLGIELPPNRFGIGLKFFNDNSGDVFAPSVVSDDDDHNDVGGVVRGWVFVIPDGWAASEPLGVSGDWVIRAVVEVCDAQEPCPWDMNTNGSVDVSDLLVLLGLWGSNPGGPPDFDLSGAVDVADLLKLLARWGPCP